ncbi:MAG: N-6 DNA methylase [Thaumarchaeota archaeon]|nr:N-6 DNA methylase [Nitrososphaerota archaeon]
MPGLEELEKELPSYIAQIKATRSQPGKEIVFTRFIERVFGIKPETITMEVPISSRVLVVRGRVDAVFGNILMEFKVDLRRELDDAKVELTKYFQAYYEKMPDRSYIGIAHDGLSFLVFQPIFEVQEATGKPYVKSIRQTDSLSLEREQNLEKIYLWFDSYLFVTEKAIPTSDDIKKRLGTESPTFYGILAKFEYFYEIAMKHKHNRVKYDNWAKTLEIVYGDRVDGKLLFIKHTYLATVAKLLVHLIVTKPKSVSKTDVRAIIYGDTFAQYGISNFIEEDFYTWVLDKDVRPQAIELLFSLMKELMVYDLEKVDEDFLKSLYEELVDPEVRRDLGEYYTPDWLAQLIIETILTENPKGSILDPACGSGTFLFSAIKKKIEFLKAKQNTPAEILEHITSNVVGADVHPLAVIIARTNYLLALRNLLLQRGSARVFIPIYLCDTLRIPQVSVDIGSPEPAYKIDAIGKTAFSLPTFLISDPQLLDLVLDRMGAAAREYEKVREQYPNATKSARSGIERGFEAYTKTIFKEPLVVESCVINLRRLLDLVESDSNSIWSFILKNVYKPVALSKRKFDFVIGNPPWITIHFMKNPDYRKFLIRESERLGLADGQGSHQIPNIELATLFFQESAGLYLKDGSMIAFVMPKSVLLSQQHRGFRKWEKHHLQPIEIFDLEGVKPLFNVPSCVVMARKTK